MTTGTIPALFQQAPLVAPSQKVPYVNKDNGHLHNVGFQQSSQMHGNFNGTSRRVPCSCVSSGGTYTLTPNPGGPLITGYFDYENFVFVADQTAGGAVSITVVPNGPAANAVLPTLPAYTANGATLAGAASLTSGLQYEATFVDVLNGGNGGFVLR